MKDRFCDLVVCSGSLRGCLTAARAAEAGLRVVLVESREFLGGSMVGGNRLFICKEELSSDAGIALWELGVLREEEFPAAEKIFPLYEGEIKQRLLERMLTAGVRVLFLARPVGVSYREGKLCGVTLATKHGALFLRSKHIYDNEDGLCAALAAGEGLSLRERTEVTLLSRVSGVEDTTPRRVPVTDTDTTVTLRPLRRREVSDEALLEIRFVLPREKLSAPEAPFLCRAAGIRRTVEVLRYLRGCDPAFAHAVISSFPYEAIAAPCLPHTQPAADITPTGEELSPAFLAALRSLPAPELPEGVPMRESEDEGLPVALWRTEFSGTARPVRAGAALAGLGTGGGAAAEALLRHGTDLAVCENKPMPGGTRTVGGVTSYWHGYRGGWNREFPQVKKAWEEAQGGSLFGAAATLEDAWLSDRMMTGGARVLNGTVFAAYLTGGRCRGFYAATDSGVYRVEANITIDATGDGDLAVFCGAEYTFGDAMGMSQGCSMWGTQEKRGLPFAESTVKGDSTVIDPTVYSDYLRAIGVSTVYNTPYAFSGMLTVRESRHIRGEFFLTLRDILTGRAFSDALTVGYCPLDAHGTNATDLDIFGFADYLKPKNHVNDSLSRAIGGTEEVAPDLPVRVPVGCFLPKSTRGLLLCGKSVSADKDAASLLRMNPEILNAGFAVGELAARCVSGCDPREADLAAVQKTLERQGILPDWTFREEFPFGMEEHITRAKRRSPGSVLYLCVAEGEEILPALRTAYAKDKDLTIAELLAYRGCADGFDTLLGALSEAKEAGRLCEYAQLLALVTRAGLCDPARRRQATAEVLSAAENFTPTADAVTPRGTPYVWSKEHNRVIGGHTLLMSLCSCASWLRDGRLCVPLLRIEALPELHGAYAPPVHYEKREPTWEREYALLPNENIFLAYARLRLLRAAAECGSREALLRMRPYLHHPDAILRRMAKEGGARE